MSAFPALPGVAEAPTTAIERGAKSGPRRREAVSLERLATALNPSPGRRARPRPGRCSTAGAARSGRGCAPSRRRPSGRRAGARRERAQVGVERVVADVEEDDPRDHERVRRHLVAAEVDDLVDAALERGRRLGDPRRGDELRRRRRDARDRPLVDLRAELGAARVRAARELLGDDRDRQLARRAGVRERVLVDAGARARADPDRGIRVERERVEERERRQVRDPGRPDRRDPGDRPRGDEPVHQPVQDAAVELDGSRIMPRRWCGA